MLLAFAQKITTAQSDELVPDFSQQSHFKLKVAFKSVEEFIPKCPTEYAFGSQLLVRTTSYAPDIPLYI